MAIKAINITGQRFGGLVVIERVASEKKGAHWLCKCDCGNELVVLGSKLLNGASTHCGCKPRNKFPEDITGMKFGRYTVITNGKNCVCQCECGSDPRYVSRTNLLNGHSKSCGCLARETAATLATREYGEAAFVKVVCAYKSNAKKRGLEFELSDNDIRALTKMRCYYCGASPARVSRATNGDYIYNGIDRIDSSRGYTVDNVVPCCTECNRAKRDLDTSDFLEWVQSIADNYWKSKWFETVDMPDSRAFRQVISVYKTSAKRRKIKWLLSDKRAYNIMRQRCHYCGKEPSNLTHRGGDEYAYNGIDRLDSSEDYTDFNCVPCCFQCNAAKRDSSAKNFIEWALRVSTNVALNGDKPHFTSYENVL